MKVSALVLLVGVTRAHQEQLKTICFNNGVCFQFANTLP